MPKSKTVFNRHVLPNGLRVITIPRPESIATNILVMAETGSKYESPRESGLSHFFEHMAFKGTKRRPKSTDISMEFDAMGARNNAFTGQEYTGYYATVQPKLVDKALDLLGDMYLNSTFPEEEIKKEAGVIVEEINMYEDIPRQQVQTLFMELLYGNQPAGRPVLGSKETVKSFTHQDFLDYRAAHYVASGTVIAVAGNFNEELMIKKIEKQFKTLSAKPKTPKLTVEENQTKPKILLKTKASDQTHLVLGVRTFAAPDDRSDIVDVLSAVLGGSMSSRLFRRVRDELGAAYYVRSDNDTYTDHGFLEVSVGTDNKRVEEIIKVVLEECKKLTDKVVPERELERVKESMIGNLFLGLETSSSLAGSFASEEIVRGKLLSPEAIARRIRAVTSKEIKQLAQQIFKKENLNLAMIGPAKEALPFESLLSL